MPISDFVARLHAAERALVNHARATVIGDVSRAHGPRHYQQSPDRPRGPDSFLIPAGSFRQPVVPIDRPGIFRRVEYLGATQNVSMALGGAGVFFSIPLGVIWRIISVRCVYTCDATAATRSLHLGILADAGSTINQMVFCGQSDVTLAAGQAAHFSWISGAARQPVSPWALAGIVMGAGALPDRLIVYEQSRFCLFTTSAQAGDVINSLELYVEEWTTFAGTAR